MNTPVKILLGFVAAALVLFAALVIAVTVIIDPNAYRPYIVKAVEDATGRPFELTGELTLDFLPCCSVSADGAALGNPQGFPGAPLATIEQASAGLKLWPLLARRQVEVSAVTLTGLRLSLVRLEDGRVNWEIAPSDEYPAADAPAPEEAPPLEDISVEAVVLRDGRIRYEDRQAGLAYTVSDLVVETGAIDYGGGDVAAFPLQITFTASDDGDGDGDATTARTALEARLALEGDRLTVSAPTLAVDATGAALPGGEAALRASAERLTVAPGEQVTVSLGDFRATLEALQATATLTGDGELGTTAAALEGTVALTETSPLRMLDALSDEGYQPADPSVLNRLAAEGRWRLAGSALTLSDLDVRLDDSHLTGSAAVENLETGAIVFDLVLDRLNLDAYLPRDDGEAEEGEEAAEIPVDMIRGLTLKGRLSAGELVLLDMPLEQVLAEVAAADGVLRLDPVTADLYGGRYRGTVTVDATGAKTDLDLRQEIAAVQVSEMLEDFFGTDVVAGSLSLNLSGNGTGNTVTELIEGLAADVSLSLSDGVYRGIDVVYELKRARALLANEAAPDPPEERVTAIRALDARGRLVDGVLQTRALTAETSALLLSGEGGVNLAELTLDYQLQAKVLEQAASAAGLSGLTDAAIPLTLRGPLTAPKLGVDLKGLVTTTVRDAVQQRARQELLKRLGDDETPPEDQPSADEDSEKEETSPRDLLERGLRDLLKPQPKPSDEE